MSNASRDVSTTRTAPLTMIPQINNKVLTVRVERCVQSVDTGTYNTLPQQKRQATQHMQMDKIKVRKFATEGASSKDVMMIDAPPPKLERDPLEPPAVTEIVDLTSETETNRKMRIKVSSTVPLPKEQIQVKIPAKLMESAIRTKNPLVLNVKGGVLVFDPAKRESRFVPMDKIPTHQELNDLIRGARSRAPQTEAPRAAGAPRVARAPAVVPPVTPSGCDRVLVPVDRAALPQPATSTSRPAAAVLSGASATGVAAYSTVKSSASPVAPTVLKPYIPPATSAELNRLKEAEKNFKETEKNLKDELRKLNQRALRLTKSNKRFIKVRKEMRKNAESTAIEKKTKYMSKYSKLFFEMQCRNSKGDKKARRYTDHEKAFALSLQRCSPKEFRFLRTVFVLPSAVSMKRNTVKNINAGIYDKVFDELSRRMQQMPERDRTHALVWDLVELQPHVLYESSSDQMLGLVDWGGGQRSSDIADTALAFVLRGVFKSSTHPLAYYLFKSPVDPQVLASMVRETATRALDAGVRVVATVCDHRPENLEAVAALVSETRLEDDDPSLGDYWQAGDHRIIPVYDAGALIVSLRDHLMQYNLFFVDDNNKRRIARWDHVRKLATVNEEYEGLRMLKTLTEKHVQPHRVPPGSVPHAAQVVSATVAALLKHLSESGKLPAECEDTALALAFFDRLFDSFNSDVFQIYPDKDYRAAIRKTSVHHQLWAESKRRLDSMKFITSDDTCRVDVPVLRAWSTNIQSFQHLTKVLFGEWPDETLLARNISLDGLREMVNKMRERGCMAFTPTYQAFHGLWRQTLQDKLTERGAYTFDQYQEHLRWFVGQPMEPPPRHEALDAEDAELELADAVDADVVARLCSALLKSAPFKISKFYKCDKCKKDLTNTCEEEQFHDNFVNFVEGGSSPSQELVQCIAFIQAIVSKILPRKLNSPGITGYLRLVVDSYIDYAFIECAKHKDALTSFIASTTINNIVNTWAREINDVATGKTQTFNPDDPVHVAAHEMSRNQLVVKKQRKRRRKNLSIPMV